ncbi:MAG: glycerol-3-phosphate acyltransferase [Ignavibacteria bacterium]|nr:glycerol-3-phosphate acyltransferase [Ignavibacteria bacterium]
MTSSPDSPQWSDTCSASWPAFQGGKGMNTSLGMLIAVAPVEVAVGLGIFLVILFASGYVSLGSIAAAVIMPSTMAFRYNVLGVSIEGYPTRWSWS